MMVNLSNIERRRQRVQRETIRRMKVAAFAKGVLAAIALGAAAYGSIAIPSYIHSRHCSGCNWFWCDNYDGTGDI